MLDTRDWCDVDSDEEFCIPELPPLPFMKWQMPVKDIVTTNEEQSPKTASVVTSNNHKRSRFDFFKESSPKSKSGKAGFVCFIGKFPNQTNITDLRGFVKSKGINFTDVRIGPKKRPNATTFGYVDLPTKQDYEKLLAFDGTMYRGRAIRVDHATRKETSTKTPNTKKFKQQRDLYTPPSRVAPRQTKSPNRRGHFLKNADVHPKKTGVRSQRFKTLRSQKTGTRSKQKYRKESRCSVPLLKGKRFIEAFGRK